MFAAQRLGLLARGGFQGPGGQARDSGRGYLLHLVQIDVETRPGFAKGMADDHFSPLPGQFLDMLEIGGCELPCPHDASFLEVKAISAGELTHRQSRQSPLPRKVVPALLPSSLATQTPVAPIRPA